MDGSHFNSIKKWYVGEEEWGKEKKMDGGWGSMRRNGR